MAVKTVIQEFPIATVDTIQIHEFIVKLRSCKNIRTGRANKLTFTRIA